MREIATRREGLNDIGHLHRHKKMTPGGAQAASGVIRDGRPLEAPALSCA
jgi:hypothetical protein